MKNLILPPLYAIVNVEQYASGLEQISKLLEAKVKLIQIRAKALDKDEALRLAKSAVALRDEKCSRDTVKIIINDSPEICKLAHADGVHLGQDDISPHSARELLGQNAIIGLSTHSLAQAADAPCSVLDYIGVGPIFNSPTKFGHAPLVGLEQLSAITNKSSLPVVAIGGINVENAASVFKAGAASVAVISAIAKTEDLEETIVAFSLAKKNVY